MSTPDGNNGGTASQFIDHRLCPRHVTVIFTGVIPKTFDIFRQGVSDRHRSMVTAGTADRDNQRTLSFFPTLWYKKISLITNAEDYRDIADEFIDRFGDMPKSVVRLLDVSLARALGEKCGIERVVKFEGFVFVDGKGRTVRSILI